MILWEHIWGLLKLLEWYGDHPTECHKMQITGNKTALARMQWINICFDFVLSVYDFVFTLHQKHIIVINK